MKKISTRFLTTLLALAILVAGLPVSVFADQIHGTSSSNVQMIDLSNDSVLLRADEISDAVMEEKDKRTENTKYIRLADGSHYVAQYETSIHYQDESGTWQEFDNTLVYSAASSDDEVNGYETSNNKRSIKFANNSNSSKLLTIKDDKYKINFGLVGANGTKGVTVINPKESDPNETKLEQITVVKKNISSVVYEDVWDSVDLQYIVIGNDIKENIIVKNQSDSYSYTFNLKLNKLYAEMQPNGTIGLYDEKDGTLQYIIPLPFMYDANNMSSDAVEFSLKQIKNKEYELTVTAASSWMNADDRAYPVTIDPAINKNTASAITDLMINEKFPTTNYSDTATPWVGYMGGTDGVRGITLVKLNSLPSIPAKAIITNATITLRCAYVLNTAAMRVGAYQINHSWDSTATWNSFYTNTAISDKLLDYQNLDTTQTYDWNITRLVKAWYDGSAANYGIAFDSVTYDFYTGSNQIAIALDSTETTSGTAPLFTIVYRDSKGIEDYYTYQTFTAGNAGTAYVSDYTSEMTLIKNDLSYANASLGFDIYHTYNTVYAGKYFSYQSTDGINAINTVNYGAMHFGDGWKLNIQETVKAISVDGASAPYFVYNDADGTDHYFLYTGPGEYRDEDGLSLTLTSAYYMDTATLAYILTDAYGNRKDFANGILTKMTDADGNTIRIYYLSSGNTTPTLYPKGNGTDVVSHITIQTAEQTAEETVMQFVFDTATGCLTSITNTVDQTTTRFTYTYHSATDTYLLTGVVNADGTVSSYVYTDGVMIRAYDTTNAYGFEFGYLENTTKVVSADEYVNDLLRGKNYRFDNEFGSHCVVTYGGADGLIGDRGEDANVWLDNILTEYVFDYSGRTISSSSRTYSDMILLSSSNVAYIDPGDNLTNQQNLIGRTYSSGQKASNYIKQGSFERNDGEWNSFTRGYLVRSGSYSAKLTGDLSAEVHVSQALDIVTHYSITGTSYYVFSAYVNTSEVTSFSENGGVYIKMVRPNGTEIKSDVLRVKTSADVAGGWIRLSLLFDTFYTDATVYLCASGVSGNVYFDDVQVGYSHAPSAYSYLQNGSMDQGRLSENTSSYYGWTYSSNGNLSIQQCDDTNGVQGYAYFSLEGSPLYKSRVTQTVYLREPGYSSYALSGWAKASSVFGADSTFAMKAVVTYTNNISEEFVFDFNRESTEWQYNEGLIEPFSTIEDETLRENYLNMLLQDSMRIDSIQISFLYDYNSGSACIDEFNLIKTSSSSYEYNADGEITKEISGTDVTTYTYDLTDPENPSYTVQTNNEPAYTVSRDKFYRISGIAEDGMTMSMQLSHGKYTRIAIMGDDGSTLYSDTFYSADGKQVLSEEDTNGSSVLYGYNSKGQLISVTTPRPGTVSDEETVKREYSYNSNGLLSAEYISGLVSLAYTYDNGQITKILRSASPQNVDETQNLCYYYTYTPFGRLATISTGADIPLVEYDPDYLGTDRYAGNPNPSVIRLANNNLIGYTYDSLDRVVLIQYGQEEYPNINKARITYDDKGNIFRVEDVELGMVYLYDYGEDGALCYAVVLHPNGEQQILYAAKDSGGRTVSATTALGQTQSVTTVYTYGDTETMISDKLTGLALAYQNGSTTINNAFSYTYDSLDRLSSTTLSGNGKTLTHAYSYKALEENRTTNLISSLSWTSPEIDTLTFSYEYDALGNITATYENGVLTASYQYDAQGQLTNEYLPTKNVKYSYTYDAYGNILSAVKRNATTDAELDSQSYSYWNAQMEQDEQKQPNAWSDRLIGFNHAEITYDASGNPLIYNNGSAYTFEWDTARNLTSVVKGGVTTSYEYNADGLRTEKLYGTTTYKYYYDGDKLLRQSWGPEYIDFLYDATGEIYGLIYDGTQYFYVKNAQGDVVQIRSVWGTAVVEYEYDAWGNILSIDGLYADTLGDKNPIRYRSYYYDHETGFYYLQSRYYDPQVRRFISADDPGMLGATGAFLSYNLYAYCENNPANCFDPYGYLVLSTTWVGFALDMVFTLFAGWFKWSYDIIGMGLSKTFERFGAKRLADKLLTSVVPKVIGLMSKGLTLIRTAIWRVTGATIANLTSTGVASFFAWLVAKLNSADTDELYRFISMFFTTGSLIAGFLDKILDGDLDGYIRIGE